jgi:ATP-dependent Clp protease adaptor protein ClpS
MEPDVDEDVRVDRPYVVIVWNDPINLMSYVTHVLQKLFGYSLEKATELMLDVHHKGKAVVASAAREQAELHVFRLHEHGLWATMEHDT